MKAGARRQNVLTDTLSLFVIWVILILFVKRREEILGRQLAVILIMAQVNTTKIMKMVH